MIGRLGASADASVMTPSRRWFKFQTDAKERRDTFGFQVDMQPLLDCGLCTVEQGCKQTYYPEKHKLADYEEPPTPNA